MPFIYRLFLWLLFNISSIILLELALFTQITSSVESESLWIKLLISEFWATLEWGFVIPVQRIGITFLNPAQLALSSYLFVFLGQLVANSMWLHIKTTIDDYIGMVILLLGMYVAKYRVFG